MLKKVGKKSKKNEAGRKSYIYDALSKTICNIIHHCVKSVCIRSFSGPYFPALDSIRRDAGLLSVFTPNTDTQCTCLFQSQFQANTVLLGLSQIVVLAKRTQDNSKFCCFKEESGNR